MARVSASLLHRLLQPSSRARGAGFMESKTVLGRLQFELKDALAVRAVRVLWCAQLFVSDRYLRLSLFVPTNHCLRSQVKCKAVQRTQWR